VNTAPARISTTSARAVAAEADAPWSWDLAVLARIDRSLAWLLQGNVSIGPRWGHAQGSLVYLAAARASSAATWSRRLAGSSTSAWSPKPSTQLTTSTVPLTSIASSIPLGTRQQVNRKIFDVNEEVARSGEVLALERRLELAEHLVEVLTEAGACEEVEGRARQVERKHLARCQRDRLVARARHEAPHLLLAGGHLVERLSSQLERAEVADRRAHAALEPLGDVVDAHAGTRVQFRQRYSKAGIKVVVSSRDHREYDEEIERRDFQIAVVVFEKIQAARAASGSCSRPRRSPWA
jgi:hypothetical protein